MEHYIKPCAKCGRANLTITVITLKSAQFYTLACPRCDEMTMIYRTREEAEAHLEKDYERLTGKPLSSR